MVKIYALVAVVLSGINAQTSLVPNDACSCATKKGYGWAKGKCVRGKKTNCVECPTQQKCIARNCGSVTNACQCAKKKGCGWDSTSGGQCKAGKKTGCDECASQAVCMKNKFSCSRAKTACDCAKIHKKHKCGWTDKSGVGTCMPDKGTNCDECSTQKKCLGKKPKPAAAVPAYTAPQASWTPDASFAAAAPAFTTYTPNKLYEKYSPVYNPTAPVVEVAAPVVDVVQEVAEETLSLWEQALLNWEMSQTTTAAPGAAAAWWNTPASAAPAPAVTNQWSAPAAPAVTNQWWNEVPVVETSWEKALREAGFSNQAPAAAPAVNTNQWWTGRR